MKKILLLAISYLLLAAPVLAQDIGVPNVSLPGFGLKPNLTLSAEPATPRPGFTIALTANLAGINVGNSDYDWFLNGRREAGASGLNKNVFAFKVGALGGVYTAEVRVATPAGDILSDSMNFTVSDFDLTWDAASEAPADYPGKILPTKNSNVAVSVLPFVYVPGTRNLIGSSGLIYNWHLDEQFQSSQSGLNKPQFSFRSGNFLAKTVRLEIRNPSGTVSLSKSIDIPVASPMVLIYSADAKTGRPLGGALKSLITAAGGTLNFAAKTYFFNAAPERLSWQWLVGSEAVSGTPAEPWLASLNAVKNLTLPFYAQIRAAVQNPADEEESASSSFNIQIR